MHLPRNGSTNEYMTYYATTHTRVPCIAAFLLVQDLDPDPQLDG